MTDALSLEQKKAKPIKKRWSLALRDIFEGFQNWRIWLTLGWQDIILRYRRSILGPFWITLSMGVMIYSMGFIYSFLFKANISSYFPHVASGILMWTFLSTVIMDFVSGFIDSSHIITQIKLPFTTHILRILVRNYIIFLHNLLAVLPILIYFKIPVKLPACIIGLLLIGFCSFFYGMILSMIGARFRDMKQFVQSLLQVIFYITPIMWLPDMLPVKFAFVIKMNPFYQLIELVRSPLMGNLPSSNILTSILLLTTFGMSLMLLILFKARHRIAFWI